MPRRVSPRAYDEYLKAYSMAMLPGRERENVSFGGKSTRHAPTVRRLKLTYTPFVSYHAPIIPCEPDQLGP